MSARNRSRIAIVGAHGYSGLELARLVLRHPHMELVACFARDPHWELNDELPSLQARSVQILPMDILAEKAPEFESVFFATPPEVSVEWISKIYANQNRIPQLIDLSGAYRLNFMDAKNTYGLIHPFPELLVKAEYGLSPWTKISTCSSLISNPGCFATSVLLAIIPLLKAELIEPDSLVMDCKSGSSGAGKKAQERLLFTEVDGECLPYRVGTHQHLPEIRRYVERYAHTRIDPVFVTSLLPIRRGIISGIYSRLSKNLISYSESDALAEVDKAYREAYSSYPLVQLGSLGSNEKRDRSLLSLRRVVGSARTHLSYVVHGSKLHVFSCIDNLLKGAAGQAIENWNLSHGLKVDCGLENLEVLL